LIPRSHGVGPWSEGASLFSILFLLVLGGAMLAWYRCSYHFLEIIALVP
jgi:hypothetical protein